MKRALMTIALGLCIAAVWTGQSQAQTKGEIVAAKWGSSWYMAVIEGVEEGGKFDVIYCDGTGGDDLVADDIKTIPTDPGLQVGDKVLGVWSGVQFFEGEVVEVCQLSYKVKWADGSSPSWVPAGKILKL